MIADYPGADLIVRATITETFVNCPRYIAPQAHGTSKYVPDVTGAAPLPGWKKIDALQPFLPGRFQGLAQAEDDLITMEEYATLERGSRLTRSVTLRTFIAFHRLTDPSRGALMSNHPDAAPSQASRDRLRATWRVERAAARSWRRQPRDVADEWRHLERAHVLSQAMAAAHVRTHLAMLGYGIRRHDPREVVGQVIRLAVAGPGSLSGRYPSATPAGPASASVPSSQFQRSRSVLGTIT